MQTAKLFQNGQSQAVRLPKSCRLPGQEVYVRKVGRAVVLLPMDEGFETLFESLAQFSDDFMAEREQLAQPPRDNPFE